MVMHEAMLQQSTFRVLSDKETFTKVINTGATIICNTL